MSISFGMPSNSVSQSDRVNMLITAVGGPVRAAALINRSRSHIDNMRKPDAVLRLDDLLVLCREARVTIDWVATGYQVRPELRELMARSLSNSGASVAEATALMDRIEEGFRIEPSWPLPADRRAALAGDREALVGFALDPGLPGSLRARADTMLVAAFQDEGAKARMQDRERQRGYERAADNLRVDEAIAAAGWDPGDDARLALYQLVALHGASTESLVFLLETLAGRFRRPPP